MLFMMGDMNAELKMIEAFGVMFLVVMGRKYESKEY